MTPLTTGQPIYLRYYQVDVLTGLYPMYVVERNERGLLTYAPGGSWNWFPFMRDGRQMRDTPLPEWHGADWEWDSVAFPHSALAWFEAGRPYSIQLRWSAGRFIGYYVNIEEPAVAWAEGGEAGIDSEDWDLDLVVDPDLTWHLKDEDDLTSRLAWPELYWVKDPRRVYRIVDEATALVRSRAFPFDGTWRDFAPDPTWAPIIEEQPPTFVDPRRHR